MGARGPTRCQHSFAREAIAAFSTPPAFYSSFATNFIVPLSRYFDQSAAAHSALLRESVGAAAAAITHTITSKRAPAAQVTAAEPASATAQAYSELSAEMRAEGSASSGGWLS